MILEMLLIGYETFSDGPKAKRTRGKQTDLIKFKILSWQYIYKYYMHMLYACIYIERDNTLSQL